MSDLDLLAGTFFEFDIPVEKRFLLKYFKNDLQRAFLKYHMVTGEVWNFTDHTGYHCTRRFAYRLAKRYKRIMNDHAAVKGVLDEEAMERVYKIESGKLPLTRFSKS
jgi:hypothetical protein